MFDTLTDQPADLESTGDVVFMAAEDPTSDLKVDAHGRSVVVANWGHWRLRDGDVETYVRDWKTTIRALSNFRRGRADPLIDIQRKGARRSALWAP